MRKEMLMEDTILELYAGLAQEAARDTAPEKCPICTAPKRRFNRITAQ